MQFDSRQLAALSAILRLGSFEAAANALGVTQSAISQRLKALEEQVGAVLVLRESPCRGTQAGARLAAHAAAVALLESGVSEDLGTTKEADGAAVPVRIALNADSLATWFLAALEGLDGLSFDLVIDDQAHSADWLRRGEVMAAVCDHPRAVQGCDVHSLGRLRYAATASPAFIKRWFPDGVTKAALARAPMLQFNEKDDLQARWMAEHVGEGITPPTHRLASSRAFVEASARGIGWGVNPIELVWRHLRRGTLVPLIADAPLEVPLYWQVSRMLAPVLAPLTGQVLTRAAEKLAQEEG
ncbi:LysR family transcriptional regulator ArgP [Aquicoccus sp. G2-2]|uniref:LysR family transcriptional regulator ArgP n=1 Tax=Aquicoccus sp. G2-2 TaxID=3092120 RepID=UPI002ADF330D|nr:LysR family transcriptional regulator ArgP [Aquicoccus sp. G2-2]MEA1112878.1 LysR family transcriptional regulator ArgP [Aquicoccus sp. G2-2]